RFERRARLRTALAIAGGFVALAASARAQEGAPEAAKPPEAPEAAKPPEAPEPGPPEAAKPPEAPPGDEVIEDPELAGKVGAAETGGAATDEVIEDPELAGKARPGPAPAAPPSGEISGAEPAHWRVVLATRWGLDTQWPWPSQEIVEGTTIGLIEVAQRRSETLTYSLGMRARHNAGSRRDG